MSVSAKHPKFTEAHGKGPRACILWDNQGQDIITAGADARLLIHKSGGESLTPSVLHQKAVTSLALSPNGLLLASASLDHSVKLYSYPGMHTEQCLASAPKLMIRGAFKSGLNGIRRKGWTSHLL